MNAVTETTQKWRPIFMNVVANCKIKSRDNPSDLDGSGSAMTLWDSQRRYLDNLAEGMDQGVRTFVCLKSRQLGVSTVSFILDVAWLAMHPGTKGALVVHNGQAKEDMRNQIKEIVGSFPPKFFGSAFQIKKGQDNRESTGFSNGSSLKYIVAGEKDAEKETFGDGAGYSLVHFTECALYASPKALASFEQALSTTNPNRLYVYESRANGFNHWKDMWADAGRDYFTKRRFFIGWWSREDQIIPRTDRRFPMYGLAHPNGEESGLMNEVYHLYKHRITPEQLAWYRWKASDEKISMETMHAHQPWTETQAFVAGGFSFFGTKAITDVFEDMSNFPTDYEYQAYRYIVGNDFFATFLEKLGPETPREQRQLRVWEDPVPGGKYVIGMDPAFGRNDNKDRHSISIWRCYADCMDQVAEYADNSVITEHAAWILCHLAGAYDDCVINVELSGGPGQLVMQALDHVRQLLTSEMFESRVKDRKMEEFLASARWFLYKRPDSMGPGYVYNSMTTGNSKLPMMEAFRAAHRNGSLIIRSDPLLREMNSMRQDGIRVEAPGNLKDDRVIAAALANSAWRQWQQPGLMAAGVTRASQREREAGLAPSLGGVLNGFVRNYLNAMEAGEMDAPRAPEWMISRGLA